MSLLLLLSCQCDLGLEPRSLAPTEPLLGLTVSSWMRGSPYSKFLWNSSFSACWDLGYPKAGHSLRGPGCGDCTHGHCMSTRGHPNPTFPASPSLMWALPACFPEWGGSVAVLSHLPNFFTVSAGGGSALLPAPIPPVTLEEKQTLTKLLAARGANIQELNTIRKALSQLKGGGLARAAYPAQVHGLLLPQAALGWRSPHAPGR